MNRRTWRISSFQSSIVNRQSKEGGMSRERCTLLLVFLFVFGWPGVARPQEMEALARTYVPKLERNLKENIAPFWLSKALDQKNGGYIINFGPRGEAKG